MDSQAALRQLESHELAEANLRRMLKLCEHDLARKDELLGRARRDVRYKALLDLWLYVHVPLSFALLAALISHIVAVFFYW